MEILDGQLHEPGIQRFWRHTDVSTRRAALGEALDTMLAAVGVDGAVLHPIEDAGWAHGAAAAAPDRFAVIRMVARSAFGDLRWECIDPDAPDLLAQMEEATTLPGFVAFRLGLLSPRDLPFPGSGYERTLRFCTDRGIPVCSPCAHRPAVADSIAREFPELTLIVDQMALGAQPGQPEHAWRALPEVLALAARKNVHLKLTGLAALSTKEYPYTDLREPLLRVLDAFGADRCLWASDISMYRGQIGCMNRFPALVGPYPGKHTYAQSVGVLRDADWLDDDARAHLLGATARRVLRWPRPR